MAKSNEPRLTISNAVVEPKDPKESPLPGDGEYYEITNVDELEGLFDADPPLQKAESRLEKLILIIDEVSDYRSAGMWVQIAQRRSYRVMLVTGDNSGIVQPILIRLLAIIRFDGTLLDIIFQGEPDGGIVIWRGVVSAGQSARAGKLAVYTKDNRQDISEFAERYADGRICLSTVRANREAFFDDFSAILQLSTDFCTDSVVDCPYPTSPRSV